LLFITINYSSLVKVFFEFATAESKLCSNRNKRSKKRTKKNLKEIKKEQKPIKK